MRLFIAFLFGSVCVGGGEGGWMGVFVCVCVYMSTFTLLVPSMCGIIIFCYNQVA